MMQTILLIVQKSISLTGILIIVSGIVIASVQYVSFLSSANIIKHNEKVNGIRLNLGRILILGLEFIVAGDLIGTLTKPDYYDVGILAIIVAIRTLLSYSINKEITSLVKEK